MKTPWEIELIKPEQKWEITLNDKVAYTLPIASPEQLGGVKPDSKTSDMDIPVAVDEEGKLWTKDNIDETLSIKGFSADAAAVGEALKNIKVDGFVSYTEQTLTDQQKVQARINIGAGVNFVQPFVPYYYQEAESGGYLLALMYINIEDMKDGVFYAPPANTNVYKYYLYFNIVCDDGTEKNVAKYVRFPAEAVFYKTSDGNYITLSEENMLYFIDCSDKSTADKVTFNIAKNIKYIGVNNSTKFTPKSDYHPATKKYVDDEITIALNESSNGVGIKSIRIEEVV